MMRIFDAHSPAANNLLDQNDFYLIFMDDIEKTRHELIIDSPFITHKRLSVLLPSICSAINRGVRVAVNTKPPEEHEIAYRPQVEDCIMRLYNAGVEVLYTGGHHRKIAIFDRKIIYEGSLNILSQNESCEVMRRTKSKRLARQMFTFCKYNLI